MIESNELAKHKLITENSWEIQININGRCENPERRNMPEYRGICKISRNFAEYAGISRNMQNIKEFRGICKISRNFKEYAGITGIADVDFWQHGRFVVLIVRIIPFWKMNISHCDGK